MANRFRRWIPRVSLRGSLVIVAFVAVTLMAMKTASPTWVTLLGSLTVLVWTAAVIWGAVERGGRRAWAIGFSVAMAVYGVTVARDPPVKASYVLSQPFIQYEGRHPTVLAMSELWKSLVDVYYVERGTDKKLKMFNPSFDISLNVAPDHIHSSTQVSTGRKPGYGFVGGEGLIGVTVPGNLQWPDWYLGLRPSPKEFFQIGHCLWSLGLGYVGGWLAMHFYRRRQQREECEPLAAAAAVK